MGLNNRKAAIVTGGSRGIGRGICQALAADGYDLCIVYVNNEEAAGETADLCKDADPECRCITVKADASLEEGAVKIVAACTDAFGRIDVLINNAGITRDARVRKMTSENWKAVIDTDLSSVFYCSKAAAAVMAQQGEGRIVSLASIAALNGHFGQGNYAAAKAGVIALTKTMAVEYARDHITVNAVAPGLIDTDMTSVMPPAARESSIASIPLKRIGVPADVANAVSFLVSDKAAYITGQLLCIDGGLSLQ